MLGDELSTRVKKHCKIFINEALSKERFKLFCNLKSVAKNLGIKYVWHRGGKFMARVHGRDRAQVFELLSDLQAILCASRNKIVGNGVSNVPNIIDSSHANLVCSAENMNK